MSVTIIDYGMGNLASVSRALAELGGDSEIAKTPDLLSKAVRIVLPGVGNFSLAMESLRNAGWPDAIRAEVARGKPFLGICLGMQLLASHGTEGGDCQGLDLIPGDVVRLDRHGCELRIPHVGWNEVVPENASPLLHKIPAGTDFYFVHSYGFVPAASEHVAGRSMYGVSIVAAVAKDNVFGTQFHPEKSSKAGFQVLRNFLEHPAC